MKRFILTVTILTSLVWMACNNKNSTRETSKDTTDVKNVTGNDTASVYALVQSYLDLKNALTNDDKDAAASAANEITSELDKLDKANLARDHRKIFDEVKVDIREHASHISGSPIDHQREHFDLLSQDFIDLIRITGFAQTLYLDFCPMYNNKKGASWLSETNEIRNPYYGKEMSECGELKEEFKGK